MANRPRRHIVVDSDYSFRKYINFAFDENRHVTRLLDVSACLFDKPVIQPTEKLYSTESVIDSYFKLKDGKIYHVCNEAIFDRRDPHVKNWLYMTSDIACILTHDFNLKYIPLSAYNTALQCHTTKTLELLDYKCLSQFWIRNPDDKISDCSMSFTTSSDYKADQFCNFDLGTVIESDYVKKHLLSSRYLNLSFRLKLKDSDHYTLENCSYTDYEKVFEYRLSDKYCNNVWTFEVIVEAYDCVTGDVVEDANGYVDISRTINCIAYGTQCRITNGRGSFYIHSDIIDCDEFEVAISVSLKNNIRLILRK